MLIACNHNGPWTDIWAFSLEHFSIDSHYAGITMELR